MLYFWISLGWTDAGADWLQKIDQANAIHSAHTTLELKTRDSRGSSSIRKMEIWQLEDHSRLIRMQSPARIKGISLLIQNEENLHLFLPHYPPARRVLNSDRSDAFLGTDFTIDDLARIQYSTQYTATYNGKDEKGHHLLLSPLDSKKRQQAELWCDEAGHVLEILHYHKDGEVIRQLQFSEYQNVNGVDLAHSVIVTNMVAKQSTTAKLKTAEVNITLSDEIFTISSLEKSP